MVPGAETVAGYARQVRAYMAATEARRWMIVLMTSGIMVKGIMHNPDSSGQVEN